MSRIPSKNCLEQQNCHVRSLLLLEKDHYTKHYKQKAEKLSANVYSDTGICLHPLARNPRNLLQNIIKDFDYGQEFFVWHEVINNTITDHPFYPRAPLSSAQLLKEVRALKQIVDVVYCEREGAPGIQSELKTVNIAVVNVVKDLIYNSKRKYSSQINEYNELHQQHSLEIHSLEIVINNGIDLDRLLKKRKTPNKQQRKAKQQKLEET